VAAPRDRPRNKGDRREEYRRRRDDGGRVVSGHLSSRILNEARKQREEADSESYEHNNNHRRYCCDTATQQQQSNIKCVPTVCLINLCLNCYVPVSLSLCLSVSLCLCAGCIVVSEDSHPTNHSTMNPMTILMSLAWMKRINMSMTFRWMMDLYVALGAVCFDIARSHPMTPNAAHSALALVLVLTGSR
jgi:hypothetical protein